MASYSVGDESPAKEGPQMIENVDLERAMTADSYVAPEKHEKLFLSPENAVKGELRKTFGNPTPVGLAGFLLANTPATVDLMGWRGAGGIGGGNAAAGTASYIYFAGMLLAAAGIGEWVLGNTFPSVVFFTFSGFWITFGGTLMPFYAAVASYKTTTGAEDVDGFYSSFAHFLIWMGVLCFIYMVCALRTNVCLFTILALFVVTFPFLSASYIYAAAGNGAASVHCRYVGAACAFAASCVGWYLFFALLLEAVDFPVTLPVGDLSTHFKGKAERAKAKRAAMRQGSV